MDKKKREQVILLALIPIFFLGLLFMRARNTRTNYGPDGTGILSVEREWINKIPQPVPSAEIRYEPGANDPFKDLLAAYLDKLKRERPVHSKLDTKEKLPLPAMNIEGLVWNTETPQAIINGSVVKIGDNIDGVRIVKISKSGITVEYDGDAVFVPKK